MADNEIGLQAVFENDDFQKGIDEYNREVSDADQNTEEAGSRMSQVWEGLASVGAAAFAAIATGIAVMTVALYASVSAAIDAEDAMARVEFVVAGVADRTGVTTDEVNDLASSLSNVLPIDDEVIAQAIAMGLTFDGVNHDNIKPLISAAADLAAWTGKDLPSAMKDLSLSITDPDRAMRLFKEANITLTDAQKKTLKQLGDTGDTAGTTQFILEQLAQKGIIGLGEAMGDTAKGKFTIMQTAIGNLQEALGGGLLDSLKGVFDGVTAFANNPKTIKFFTDLGNTIGALANYFLAVVQDGDTLNDWLSHLPAGVRPVVKTIGEFVKTLQENLPKAFEWFINNKPLIVGILAALGVAMLAFAATVVTSIASAVAALAPVLIVMGVVGAAAGLLFKAWTEDWGGIQEKVGAAWEQVKPVFEQLQAWLGVNIPIAIQALSDFWTNVLLPALQTFFIWYTDHALPAFVSIVQWLGTNIPAAIQTLSAFWTNTLLPAIMVVADWLGTNLPIASEKLTAIWNGVLLPAIQNIWKFLSVSLFPLIQAIATFLNAVFGLALRTLAAIWQTVLLPALQSVWSFLQSNIFPIFQEIASFIVSNLQPAIEGFAGFLQGSVVPAFEGISGAISGVIDWLLQMADILNNLQLPDFLTPGSPTPFEIGLVGINKELKKLASASLPAIQQQMQVLATVRDVTDPAGRTIGNSISNSNQSTRNYLFGAQFNLPSPSGLIETLQGL